MSISETHIAPASVHPASEGSLHLTRVPADLHITHPPPWPDTLQRHPEPEVGNLDQIPLIALIFMVGTDVQSVGLSKLTRSLDRQGTSGLDGPLAPHPIPSQGHRHAWLLGSRALRTLRGQYTQTERRCQSALNAPLLTHVLFAKGTVLGGKGGSWHQPLSTHTGERSCETEKQANSHSTAENGTGQYGLLLMLPIRILGLLFNLSQ